ncbi:MAG: hypothetical protein N2053_08280 [Chitinispirillaceae bacterium]|nr:hypothetical protein [Chitinispirillaceae bacterium]
MKEVKIKELIADLNKCLEKINKIEKFYIKFKKDRVNFFKKESYDLIILADIFIDIYTCIETSFVRICKFFENNLDSERWHSHLLEKMTIEIPTVRPRVINNETFSVLQEFLKFRHFRRYYFEFEYDRKRMDYLESRFSELIDLVKKDLKRFIRRLRMIENKKEK